MAIENTDRNTLICKFWFAQIKRAEKARPLEQWQAADGRLLAGTTITGNNTARDMRRDDDKRPYVNGYRLQYEQLKSFLDQTEPSFRVVPTSPFGDDEVSIERARADMAYLKYVWSEQHLQEIESQKLDSTLRRNFGAVFTTWDIGKWMPSLKYLPAESVLVDPNCDGQLRNAEWMGFYEDISIHELKRQHPELSKADIDFMKKTGGSSLPAEQLEALETNGERELFITVRVYHIFAKNVAAVLDTGADEPELHVENKNILEELNVNTPTKYIQLVKGYSLKPLSETDWPYELDNDEYPISILRFNTPAEYLYGFTDHSQMERIDNLCDDVLRDIENDSYWSTIRKFASGQLDGDLSETEVEDFLTNDSRSFMPNFIDAEGKPKITEIPVGTPSPHLIQVYEMLTQERKTASALGELLTQEVAQFKDVTAMAARLHDSAVHQKVNRRLSGPQGYEASIAEDAVKILEIAHQKVPRYSVLDFYDEQTGEYTTLKNVKWPQTMEIMRENDKSKLIMLGADAVVGPELAEYWPDTGQFAIAYFKLSTSVTVAPGSTRTITREYRAAVWKQHLLEIYMPLYQAIGRWDLYAKFAERIGQMLGIDNIDEYLPKPQELKQFEQEQKQQKMMEMAAAQQKRGGR